MSVINSRLKNLVEKYPTARVLFEHLRSRRRARGTTDLARYRRKLAKEAGVKINPTEYLKTWQELVALGIGKFEKKGNATYFVWLWDMRNVVDTALEGIAAQAPKPVPVTPAPSQVADWQTVMVKLRPDVFATIVMPKQASKEDVGHVIKQLEGLAS